MPTSTVPFEVSLEFLNDTSRPAMLQLSRGDAELSGSATTLYPQETISLILDAGSTYHYILTQHTLKAQISCVSDRLGWYYTVDDSFAVWQYGRICTSAPRTSLLKKDCSTTVNLRSCKASRLSALIRRRPNQYLRGPLRWYRRMRMALVCKNRNINNHKKQINNVRTSNIVTQAKSRPCLLEAWISAAFLRGYFIAIHWRV